MGRTLAWWLNMVIGAALFISLGRLTLPILREYGRATRQYYRLSAEERRSLNIPEYSIARRVRAVMPANEIDAVVIDDPHPPNRNTAVFLNYYLYPLTTRTPYGFNEFRVLKKRPPTLALVDPLQPENIRRLTYLEYRDEYLRAVRVAKTTQPRKLQQFIVPFAASLDGMAGEVFVTAAMLRNPERVSARLAIEFLPQRKRAELTLKPGESADYYDLVEQLFRTLDRGWLRVTADHPIEAEFWLVNRGPDVATPLTFVSPEISLPPMREVSVTERSRVWFVNTEDRNNEVKLDGSAFIVPPYATEVRDIVETSSIEAPPHVLTFTSYKDESGRTHFAWPAEMN